MAILLLVAGHETTVNLIGNGMLALLQHPGQMELLQREPQRAAQAVEELLRYDAPVQMTSRFAAVDVELGGHVIRKGDNVVVVIGSANRDPEVHPDPHRLDITRQAIHHLGFGGGIHYCLGAPLARREGQIALTTLLKETPTLRMACDKPSWRPGMVFAGCRTFRWRSAELALPSPPASRNGAATKECRFEGTQEKGEREKGVTCGSADRGWEAMRDVRAPSGGAHGRRRRGVEAADRAEAHRGRKRAAALARRAGRHGVRPVAPDLGALRLPGLHRSDGRRAHRSPVLRSAPPAPRLRRVL